MYFQVSSFAVSLFLGDIAPIDMSDGGGMNLLDITTRDWAENCLEACGGPVLRELLGEPVDSDTNLGTVSNYMIER